MHGRRPPRRPLTVLLVVTEHPSYLTRARVRRYELMRAELARAAGTDAHAVHYTDFDRLDGDAAIVLSGSDAPWAAHEARARERLAVAVRAHRGPVLGVCAGMQLQAMFVGGGVTPVAAAGRSSENGYLPIDVLDDRGLLAGLPPRPLVFQHHTEEITSLPHGFRVLASSPQCPVQAIADEGRGWWGTQFHAEVSEDDRPAGGRVLRNFFRLAGVGAPGGERPSPEGS